MDFYFSKIMTFKDKLIWSVLNHENFELTKTFLLVNIYE